jgi:hypothetical protein
LYSAGHDDYYNQNKFIILVTTERTRSHGADEQSNKSFSENPPCPVQYQRKMRTSQQNTTCHSTRIAWGWSI